MCENRSRGNKPDHSGHCGPNCSHITATGNTRIKFNFFSAYFIALREDILGTGREDVDSTVKYVKHIDTAL